jgi:F0F1-type ATP synthase delta subunit
MIRMQVARYVASQLPQQRQRSLQEAAAWLIATNRTRQAHYLAQDVAMILARDGYLAAQVTSARPLEPKVKTEIEAFLSKLTAVQHIELTAAVDSSLLGGLRVTTPGAELDATVRTKLTTLASLGGRP